MKIHMDAKSNRRAPSHGIRVGSQARNGLRARENGRRSGEAQTAVLELRDASAQGIARSDIFWPDVLPMPSGILKFVKKSITINMLIRSLLAFSLILGACTAIFVGVAGGYRSPLSASPDAGGGATVADAHGAGLLRAASFPATSSQSNEFLGGVNPPR